MTKNIPPEIGVFSVLPNEALVCVKTVAALYQCSEATVWRRVKSGLLPAPVRVSPQQTRWRAGSIRAALEALGGLR